jgi:hypothetical protein
MFFTRNENKGVQENPLLNKTTSPSNTNKYVEKKKQNGDKIKELFKKKKKESSSSMTASGSVASSTTPAVKVIEK